eukprot:379173-Karenia_brevis.AAC.1
MSGKHFNSLSPPSSGQPCLIIQNKANTRCIFTTIGNRNVIDKYELNFTPVYEGYWWPILST